MRFIKKKDTMNGWKISFAWFPVEIEGTVIWLERYWSRFEGLYTNVRLFEEQPI